MNKKLFVPEKKVIGATSPVPKAVTKAFPKIEESKNKYVALNSYKKNQLIAWLKQL